MNFVKDLFGQICSDMDEADQVVDQLILLEFISRIDATDFFFVVQQLEEIDEQIEQISENQLPESKNLVQMCALSMYLKSLYQTIRYGPPSQPDGTTIDLDSLRDYICIPDSKLLAKINEIMKGVYKMKTKQLIC